MYYNQKALLSYTSKSPIHLKQDLKETVDFYKELQNGKVNISTLFNLETFHENGFLLIEKPDRQITKKALLDHSLHIQFKEKARSIFRSFFTSNINVNWSLENLGVRKDGTLYLANIFQNKEETINRSLLTPGLTAWIKTNSDWNYFMKDIPESSQLPFKPVLITVIKPSIFRQPGNGKNYPSLLIQE